MFESQKYFSQKVFFFLGGGGGGGVGQLSVIETAISSVISFKNCI